MMFSCAFRLQSPSFPAIIIALASLKVLVASINDKINDTLPPEPTTLHTECGSIEPDNGRSNAVEVTGISGSANLY